MKSFLRRLVYGVAHGLRGRVADIIYVLTEGRRLLRLRNKYAGCECFVIGNGPSLNDVDITALAGKYTFVMNVFVLHDKFDSLSPRFYCASNRLLLGSDFFKYDVWPFLQDREEIIKFFDWSAKPVVQGLGRTAENVYYLRHDFGRLIYEKRYIHFSVWRRLRASLTTVVIQDVIPLAIYMGFSKIYLVGCDGNYLGFQRDKSHFYRESDHPRLLELHEYGDRLYEEYYRKNTYTAETNREYQILDRYARRQGVRIINCTLGSSIDVLEREDLKNTLKGVATVGPQG